MSKKDEKVVKASETAKLAEEAEKTLEERITKLENIVKSAFGVNLQGS